MIWLYLLGVAGISVVLVMSKICNPIRNALPPPIGFRGLDQEKTERAILLGCCLCTGIWVGALVGLYVFCQDLLPRWATRLGDATLFAFAAAVISYLLGTWLREHDRKH
jgi:hypothetical protein